MKRADLERLVAKEITVSHEGIDYKLQSPNWETSMRVLSFAQSTDENEQKDLSVIMEAMKIAVQGTVVFDDSDESVTDEQAERILLYTGLHSSPIGKAAMGLCGLRTVPDEDDMEDEAVPSSSRE